MECSATKNFNHLNYLNFYDWTLVTTYYLKQNLEYYKGNFNFVAKNKILYDK